MRGVDQTGPSSLRAGHCRTAAHKYTPLCTLAAALGHLRGHGDWVGVENGSQMAQGPDGEWEQDSGWQAENVIQGQRLPTAAGHC